MQRPQEVAYVYEGFEANGDLAQVGNDGCDRRLCVGEVEKLG